MIRNLIAVAVGATLVAACAGTSSPGASSSGSASPVATPSSGPTPRPSPSMSSAYVSTKFDVPFSLTLVGGGTVRAGETAANVEFVHAGLNLSAGFESLSGTTVAPAPGGAQGPWPDDLYAWLAAQPEFTPAAPRETTIGGRHAVTIDVDVQLALSDAPRVVVTAGKDEWKTVREPEKWRFAEIRTAVHSGVVIIMPAAPAAFDEAAAALDRLLASMAFVDPPTFSSANFLVPISLSLVGGWIVQEDRADDIDLQRGYVDGGIFTAATVTLPGPAKTDPYVPVPADLDGWIRQRPEFGTVSSTQVMIGGRPGMQVDADLLWASSSDNHDLFRFVGGEWLFDSISAGDRARFIVLPGDGGGGIFIYMEAKVGDFAPVAASFDDLLATLTFR